MRSGGEAGKARSVAALIYVHADIKGPGTWLFPNHYRRTINHGPSLIGSFSLEQKQDNKCTLSVTGGEDGGVVRGTKQSPKTGNSTLTHKKRGNVNKQMSDT